MVGDMLRKALDTCDIPVKVVAMESGCSSDAVYMACQGKRDIPKKVVETTSAKSFLAGIAAALQATRYKLFEYLHCDRHPQSLLRRIEKDDRKSDEARERMSFIMLEVTDRGHMLDEEQAEMRDLCMLQLEECNSVLNYIAEVNDGYQLGITNLLLGKKETAPGRQTQRTV